MNFLNTKTTPLDSFSLLSHPDTKLIVHLNDVAKSAVKKADDLNISNNLKEIIFISAIAHDFGKASKFFQERLKSGKRSRYSNHALISAFFGYFLTQNPLVFLAIRYHHLNLDNFNKMSFVDGNEKEILLKIAKNIDKEVEEIYKVFDVDLKMEEFITFLEEMDEDWGFHLEIKESNFWDFLILFSTLIDADKENAIFKGKKEEIKVDFKENFVDNYKKAFIKQKYPIDRIREKIYKKITQIDKSKDIFFLELPTGAGKTFALMKLSFMLQKEKIFYLLPFITLIEQNAAIFKDVLRCNGVDVEDSRIFFEKHSLSGEFKVKVDDEYDLDKREFLSDSFDSKVIVTTFHQFFYSFFKSKNAFLKRAINVRNAVVILDEIQAVKEDLFFVIENLFTFLIEKFRCKIIIATATMPPIDVKNGFYIKKIDQILDKNELSYFNRYDINLDIQEYNENSILDLVSKKLELKKDLLFRVNTINSANYLTDKIDNAILLTSAIPPILRQQRIKKIRESGGIVVATQVIQAGIDISLEDGFEEIAPLDMLVQSMGRRNRSGEKTRGYADVVRFIYNGFDGSRVYPAGLMRRTTRVVKNLQVVSEERLRELLKRYYKSMIKKKDLLKTLENFNFKEIDKKFNLIDEVQSFSFFTILDERSEKLWQKLMELDEREKKLQENFWENKRAIEEEFNKIKKEVFLYVCNVRVFEKDIAYKLDNVFEKAMFLYKADERIFDFQKGVNLKNFLTEEDIFW